MPGVEEQGRGEKASKAAYLMVKGSIGEDLCSREEFTAALRYAGFNPSHRTTSNYWTETTRQITFSQFCNIAEIEPVPTEETLVSAFQKLDEKGLGYITHDDFLLSMTTRGEKLPSSVIDNMLQDTRYNRDRKFLYPAYCEAVVETTKILSELAVDKITREEEDFSVNSQTYKVRRKTASPVKTENSLKPSSSPKKTTSLEPGAGSPLSQNSTQQGSPSPAGGEEVAWRSKVSSKGSFYFESDALISHQYQVSVPVPSTCRLAIQAQEQYKNMAPLIDVQIYLFDENKRFICRMSKYTSLTRISDSFVGLPSIANQANGFGKGGLRRVATLYLPTPLVLDCVAENQVLDKNNRLSSETRKSGFPNSSGRFSKTSSTGWTWTTAGRSPGRSSTCSTGEQAGRRWPTRSGRWRWLSRTSPSTTTSSLSTGSSPSTRWRPRTTRATPGNYGLPYRQWVTIGL